MLNIEAIKSAGVTYVTENPESLDPNLIYFADIDIKDHGVITIMLYHDYAPITTANFIKLSTEDFYDGLTFHRIMSGFMMQGGDPLGNGQGGSSQNIVGEFVQNGHPNYLSHARGAVSMARATDYNSASSQFFIVHEDSSFLDGQYAAFGYVVSGMDIVDTICTSARPTDGNGTIPKDEQPVMNDVSIWSVEYATLVGE
ncbi:MAG: peptidylprolyl isomerase [Clostridiales bacterium]|nr:peptidylprolyl isomerase [Clostridiales bacterium]